MMMSVNPANGVELARVPYQDAAEIEAALEAAAVAQRAWRQTAIDERTQLLASVARELRTKSARLAALITSEMGKPITEAEAEVEKCAVTCDFYAEAAPRFLEGEPVASNATESSVVFDPLGVVLAIMPWNFPLWQFFRFAAPALAAGNGVVLKHAENVPQCALAIAEIMRGAGCPNGLVAALLVPVDRVAALITDRRIAAVTLTGSTRAGSAVASQAAGQLKKQVLELGGSDPFIVLADADVEAAAAVAVKARFTNNGQSCVNGKRFIVEATVADRFADGFIDGIEALRVGDPMSRDTRIGPLARADLRDNLHAQVGRTVASGARLRAGGRLVDGPGFWYAPTVLDDVTPGMAAFDEETFGPAAAIVRASDADEAIRLANQSDYGLGAALWSGDIERARSLAGQIDAGAVFINGMVASDARLPFGGIKRSGYGRELGSFGIREFTNIKTLWIGPSQ